MSASMSVSCIQAKWDNCFPTSVVVFVWALDRLMKFNRPGWELISRSCSSDNTRWYYVVVAGPTTRCKSAKHLVLKFVGAQIPFRASPMHMWRLKFSFNFWYHVEGNVKAVYFIWAIRKIEIFARVLHSNLVLRSFMSFNVKNQNHCLFWLLY